jgi:hypothetical protein
MRRSLPIWVSLTLLGVASGAQATRKAGLAKPIVLTAARGDVVDRPVRLKGSQLFLIPGAWAGAQFEFSAASTQPGTPNRLSVTLPGHKRAFVVPRADATRDGGALIDFSTMLEDDPVARKQIARNGKIWVRLRGDGPVKVSASLWDH